MSLTQRGQDQSSMYLRTAGVTTGHSSLTCKFCEYSQCRQIQILLGLWYFNQSFIVLWVIKHHISFSQWFNCLVPKKFVSKNSQKNKLPRTVYALLKNSYLLLKAEGITQPCDHELSSYINYMFQNHLFTHHSCQNKNISLVGKQWCEPRWDMWCVLLIVLG